MCTLKEVTAALQPYTLSPTPNPSRSPADSTIFPGTKKIPNLGRVTTFLSGAMDRAIVHRTWGLFSQLPSKKEEFYGTSFSFEEYMKTNNWLSGMVIHWGTATTGYLLATLPFMRKLVKKLVYKAGEGPDVEQSKNDVIEYRAVAMPDTHVVANRQAFCQAVYYGSMYSCMYSLVNSIGRFQ